ncbi:MAG: CoA transferase [Deltaproteobacteria bacterium]|nr:CoA transferase [Deltaproteobacteria bacterium]MBW2138265.1 CoA transferase [Deltaproteobacteria bacterium]
MLPFEDITILDFSQRLPGPYCSAILADLGADVLMVERAGFPPETRKVFPGLFELVNRNKKSMTLNLKNPEGQSIAQGLIGRADVLIEEFRPGVAERLGIGYDRAREINNRIIYCSISGFGQSGPYRDRVGHDVNYLSLSGILSIPGQPEKPPSRPGIPLVDLASGMFAAISIMASIRRREKNGEGERIDVSMFDAMISWMSTRAGRTLVYGEEAGDEHLSPLNNVYETKDGKKISLGILEQHFWENFCRSIGQGELLRDPRFSNPAERKGHEKILLDKLREVVSSRTLSEWEEILDWRQVPYAPVRDMVEALEDPHVKARGIVEEINGGEALGTIREVLFPVGFSGFDRAIRRPPPKWGQHTEEVLRGLGFTDEQILSLKERGVI